jgi:hypothetical protein
MIISMRKIAFILCIFSFSALAIALVLFALATSNFLLIAVILLMALLSLPLCIQWISEKRFNLFAPPVFFSVFIFLGYILPIPSFLVGEDPFSILWGYPFRSLHDALLRALLLTILGVLGFYFGYGVFVLRPMKCRPLTAVWNAHRLGLVG